MSPAGGTAHPPGGGCLLAGQVRQKTADRRGAGRFHDGAPGTDPAGGAGSDTPQAPGGFPPAPPQPNRTHTHTGDAGRAAHGPGPHHGRRVAPSRRPRRGRVGRPVARSAATRCSYTFKFIHVLTYLLSTCYVLDTGLGAEHNIKLKKNKHSPCPRSL